MKSVVFLAAALIVAGVALSGRAPAVSAAQEPVATGPARTITVVGRGEVTARPDVAVTNLGVEVTAPTVGAAMDDAEGRMKAILAAVKAAGVADKDIQTSNFSISFERQPSDIQPREGEKGTAGVYRVSNMVQVTIRDLDQVGDVIDAAVGAGANNVWGVSFSLEDTDALEAQAREKAVADAQARAESLAALNGVKVGEVIAISEVIGATPGPLYAESAKAYGGGGPVEAGEVTFATQIQIVYGIE
jgi:hypothetical protein